MKRAQGVYFYRLLEDAVVDATLCVCDRKRADLDQ